VAYSETAGKQEKGFVSMVSSSKYSQTSRHGHIWLGKRANSGIWYLKYKLPTGKYRERSTGTTSKKEALREADVVSGQLLNQKLGTADGTVPLDTMVEKYFKAKEGRIKVKSFKRVETSWASFKAWLNSAHPEVLLVRQLTSDIVREYQPHREQAGLSQRTINNDIKNLHSIFKWGMREDLTDRSPADYSKKSGTVDLYRLPRYQGDVYTDAEYQALRDEAGRRDNTLVRDMIVVFAGTGMRFEELAHLRQKNIHWKTSIPTIEVRAQNGWSPKDPDEVKSIPMLPEVQEVIRRRVKACQDDESWVFTNTVGNLIAESWTRKKLHGMFAAVGIGEDRRLHWHAFRNYFIIRCLRKGVAVPAIMRWTGHDSASMVLHYAEVIREEDVYEEFRKLS
jgi:integrase